MAEIEQTRLPGVGVRFAFTTVHGDRLGVLQKGTGERDLLVYDQRDPDACRVTLRLEEVDAETLAQLLGVSHLTRNLGAVREAVGSLVVEWLTLDARSPFAGATIGDTELRTRTGVSIVAIIHEKGATPAPGPEQAINAGDTLLVVGTLEGARAAEARLRGS